MMAKILLTAIREFKATAMTKAFFFGTILLPAIIGGVLWAAGSAGLLTQQAKPVEGVIALVDPTQGALTQRVQRYLQPAQESDTAPADEPATDASAGDATSSPPDADGSAGSDAGDAPPTDDDGAAAQASSGAAAQSPSENMNVLVETLPADVDMEAVRQRILAGELLGVAIASPESTALGGSIELLVGTQASGRAIDLIQRALRNGAVDQRIADSGNEPTEVRALVSPPAVKTNTLTTTGQTASAELLLQFLPFAGLILMAMAIFTGSGYLLMSTVEEKSSRVMEVLLSGMSPAQLMTGKIVGQGLVGLITLAIYAGLGLFAADQFDMFSLIPAGLFAWLFIYFIMGYFIFAAINAAMGAAVNEMREAQALQGPVIGVTILMIYLAIFSTMMTDNPHSTLAQVLSFIPPATPFVMPVRLGYINDPMPTWQLIGAPVVGFAGMLVSVWFAARVFRVGVLMYGQPPNLRTLVKWMRYK